MDDDALESYEEAMPGYEVLGFTGSWESTDALHCRAKGVADRGMLYIRHIPLSGEFEKTGKPKIPSNKYNPTVASAILYPRDIPRNNTTNVCIVIGTG